MTQDICFNGYLFELLVTNGLICRRCYGPGPLWQDVDGYEKRKSVEIDYRVKVNFLWLIFVRVHVVRKRCNSWEESYESMNKNRMSALRNQCFALLRRKRLTEVSSQAINNTVCNLNLLLTFSGRKCSHKCWSSILFKRIFVLFLVNLNKFFSQQKTLW